MICSDVNMNLYRNKYFCLLQSELLLNEPRRRTQIKRYGHDDAVMDISDLGSSSGADSDNDNDPTMGIGRGLL